MLIPHVLKAHDNDLDILKKIYDTLNNPHVQLVNVPNINAKQIKYLISQCDVMIASRTHASIGAYSTYVPTLEIGYSIKSKGIATDLFGTWEDYVLSSSDLYDKDILINAISFIDSNKDDINQKLQQTQPVYIQNSSEFLSNCIING